MCFVLVVTTEQRNSHFMPVSMANFSGCKAYRHGFWPTVTDYMLAWRNSILFCFVVKIQCSIHTKIEYLLCNKIIILCKMWREVVSRTGTILASTVCVHFLHLAIWHHLQLNLQYFMKRIVHYLFIILSLKWN